MRLAMRNFQFDVAGWAHFAIKRADNWRSRFLGEREDAAKQIYGAPRPSSRLAE